MNTSVSTNDQLVTEHIRFADSIAARRKRRIPPCVSLEELQSAAYMGLVDASKRYDGQQAFKTFAGPRIEGAITDYLRELRWGSRRSPVKTRAVGESDRSNETEVNDLFEVAGRLAKNSTKEILKWHFVEGQTQSEIASKLGVTRSSVNQTIQNFAKDARSRWTQDRLC